MRITPALKRNNQTPSPTMTAKLPEFNEKAIFYVPGNKLPRKNLQAVAKQGLEFLEKTTVNVAKKVADRITDPSEKALTNMYR